MLGNLPLYLAPAIYSNYPDLDASNEGSFPAKKQWT